MNKKINKKKRVDELQVGDKVILSAFFRGIEVSSEVKTVDRVSSIAVYVGKMRFNKKNWKDGRCNHRISFPQTSFRRRNKST